MGKRLYMGFKGNNNASSAVARALSDECVLLTNSFAGVKRDIESLGGDYDCVMMFGVDRNLKAGLRIEPVAEKEGVTQVSSLNLDRIQASFESVGLKAEMAKTPTHYLCNEAYRYALKKFDGKAVLIHIPTLKYVDTAFIEKIKQVCR